LGCGKADTGIEGIEHEEETRQESVAQDEVHTSTTVHTKVVDNEIDEFVATANKDINGTRPDLGVRCESVGIL